MKPDYLFASLTRTHLICGLKLMWSQ